MTGITECDGSLPVSLTSFVGRREETARIRRLLETARLVTLTGVAGVGKTRLALEAADTVRTVFPDGVRLVDLSPVTVDEPVAVAGVVTDALEPLGGHLHERRMLLILDNCEHVVGACAHVARQLLWASAGLKILATSREALHVTGEHVLRVAPLPQADAVELLRQRVAAVRPDFEVDDASTEVPTSVCADLDGLPLAIELLAERLRTVPVEQVVDRLKDRFALLTLGCRAARPHQRTLRAAVDRSWELCGPGERLLWSRLSVFAGSFTLEAAEVVCSGEGMEIEQVADVLDRLVAQSLVERPDTGATDRYRILETVRRYGWERLVEAGDSRRMGRCHHDFFLTLAEYLHDHRSGPRQVETLARLSAEHLNFLAALECRGDDIGQTRLALASALITHWTAGGFLREGQRQLERALAAAPEPTPARARALVHSAHLAQQRFDLATADRRLDEAQELAEQLDEAAVRASLSGHRGLSALFRGQLPQAVSHLERALDAHTALGDRPGEITWRRVLGAVRIIGGHSREAEAEALGESWGRVSGLMAVGRQAWALGDLRRARELTRSALEALRDSDDGVSVTHAIEQLAWITASEGDHAQAGRLLGAARSLRQHTGTALVEEHSEHCETDVRRALGPAGYYRALADGAAVDGPAQAVGYALSGGPAAEADGAAARRTLPDVLTRRERQVAVLIAQGMTNRKIAAELFLSPRTVDSHVDRIFAKLGFSSRVQVAVWCADHRMSPEAQPRSA